LTANEYGVIDRHRGCHDTIFEKAPVENVVAMFDAVKEFGYCRR
jgi:hypothetical protein